MKCPRHVTIIALAAAGLAGGAQKNPVPNTKQSISRGRNTFIRNCAGCHGNDGKALLDAGGVATDLTSPAVYKHGSTEGGIFETIHDGANGMPSFKDQLTSNEIWDVVNFIRSLWPEEIRPPIQPEDK